MVREKSPKIQKSPKTMKKGQPDLEVEDVSQRKNQENKTKEN